VLTREELIALQSDVKSVAVEKTVAQYMVELVTRTRHDDRLQLGVSPRGSLMLFRTSQAAAFLAGRKYVSPDDVQRMAPYVLGHRVILTSKSKYAGTAKVGVIRDIMESVKVPT
jgi:MoxR-like ATPase